jgi:hypothetical protein
MYRPLCRTLSSGSAAVASDEFGVGRRERGRGPAGDAPVAEQQPERVRIDRHVPVRELAGRDSNGSCSYRW